MTSNAFRLGGNVNVGTPGPQEFPSDETPPGYSYRPPETTYGDYVAISDLPHNLNEYKARLEAGRVFFRAKDVGPQGNTISVKMEEVDVVPEEQVEGHTLFRLTVKLGDIQEIYYGEQIIEDQPLVDSNGAPLEDSNGVATGETQEVYIKNAMEDIRPSVNSSSLIIEVPDRTTDLIDRDGSDHRSGRTIGRGSFASTYPEGEEHVESFDEAFLYGGQGVPSNPTFFDEYPTTGPQRTAAHINWTERNTSDGSLVIENIVVQWAGETATEGEWIQLGVRGTHGVDLPDSGIYSPRYSGSLHRMIKHDVGLCLVTKDKMNATANNFDVFDNYISNPEENAFYQPTQLDLGSEKTFTFYVETETTNDVKINYVVNARSSTSMSGEYVPWFYGTMTARYLDFEVRLENPYSAITRFKPVLNI